MGKQPQADVRIRCPIRPTEDPARVRRAVLALFPGASLTDEGGALLGQTSDLGALRQGIKAARIVDTALSVFHRGTADAAGTITFRLNKQAAHAKTVNFGVGHPLGDIDVVAATPDAEGLARWLTDGGTRQGLWGDDGEPLKRIGSRTPVAPIRRQPRNPPRSEEE